MPAAAVAAAASCSARPLGEPARRSPKTMVPMSIPETGSIVSMTGRLAASGPAW
jgi:hypothetical protein